METLNITIQVLPEKRRELMLACRSIVDQTRQKKYCQSSLIRQEESNAVIIMLKQSWSNWDAVKRYLQSDLFTVLLGAIKLLGQSYEIKINDVSQTDGQKFVKSAREENPFKELT